MFNDSKTIRAENVSQVQIKMQQVRYINDDTIK